MKIEMKQELHSTMTIWIWLALSTMLLGAFILMTSEVHEASLGETELIGTLDHQAFEFAGKMRTPQRNAIAVDITALGSGTVLVIVVTVVVLLLSFRKWYIDIVQLLIAAIGSGVLSYVMKLYFVRPRPSGLTHLVLVQSYSYPSGHSLSSAAVYFTLAILWFLKLKNHLERTLSIMLSLTIMSLIALSRIYLGVHYLSDVLAGILVGVGWAAIVASVRIFYERRQSVV